MVQSTNYRIETLTLSETQWEIIEELSNHDEIERDLLCKILKIPRTTCYDNLLKLLNKGLVKKKHKNLESRGRPKTLWRLSD